MAQGSGSGTLSDDRADSAGSQASAGGEGGPNRARHLGVRSDMDGIYPACTQCGHRRYKIINYVKICSACDYPEPIERGTSGGRDERAAGAGSPGQGGMGRQGSHGAGGRTSPRLIRGKIATAHIKFHLPALERLAKTICNAHRGSKLDDLLARAGVCETRRRGVSRQDHLYGVLARLQEGNGHDRIMGILGAACGTGAGGEIREEVNECLEPYGRKIDEGGKAGWVSHGSAPPGDDDREFDQRRYHQLVIRSARAKFAKGEHTSAVAEACKALEGLVRKKSGIDDSGVSLMAEAFGKHARLAVDLPGMSGETQKNVQLGLQFMCMGVMSGVRNPVSHEPEASLRIGRADALDMLGIISHLCRQVEGTRRVTGAKRRLPKKGGGQSPIADAPKGRVARKHEEIGQNGAKKGSGEPHGHEESHYELGRILVESQDLSYMEYEPDSETLQVWLHGGGSYLYTEVPEGVYAELLAAPSKSKYFHRHIKGMYGHRYID